MSVSDQSILNERLGLLDTKFLQESVEEVMSPAPFTLKESDTIAQALELMVEHGIGALLIVDKDEKLTGIFTERDVLMKVAASSLDLEKSELSAVMTANPRAETTTCTLAKALHDMAQGGFRHVPIVDDGMRPIGMVSVKDIMDRISTELLKGMVTSTLRSGQ